MVTSSHNRNDHVYNDFWVKIFGCLISSEIIDSLGRGESFFKRITNLYFYIDLLGGFIISLILWEIVRFVTKHLDRRFSWTEYPVQRITLQLIFGILTPAFFSFLLTLFFMRIAYKQDIFKTEWLYNEFYVVILIIILINLVYFTWWLFIRWQSVAEKSSVAASVKEMDEDNSANNGNIIYRPAAIEVTKAGKNILLPQTEIAYVFLEGSYTFMKTFKEESFVTTYTLDELTKMFDTISFFRVNRQIIISRMSCKAYQNIENGKISVDLLPTNKSPVIVSQKRAKDFRKWIAGMPAKE